VRLDALKERARNGDIDAAYEAAEKEPELRQQIEDLEMDLTEAQAMLDLSPSEQELFENRTPEEIAEMRELMELWDEGTYPDVAESILDHSARKGYDPLQYLRDAGAFSRRKSGTTTVTDWRDDNTRLWNNHRTREYLVEDTGLKIRTYGVNP